MFKQTKKNSFVDESNKVKIISSKSLFSKLDKSCIEQLYSISKLPGICDYVYGFPDLHVGHGAPVGSCFVVNADNNPIISPKAIGTDINCGIRLIRTNLKSKDLSEKQYKEIVKAFEKLPLGLSKDGVKITKQDLIEICYQGLEWAVKNSYADKFDKLYVYRQGCFRDASPKYLSKTAIEKGLTQLGTLGQGNHFIDLLVVDKVFDKKFCKRHKIEKDQILIMLHTGSRGLGYQVAEEFTKICKHKDPIEYLYLNSKDGQHYYKTMCAAANYAFVNRAVLSKKVVDALEKTLNLGRGDINARLLYDCSHNFAKLETHNKKRYLVTRKGAVRGIISERLSDNSEFLETGTPVILPGSMLDDTFVILPKEKIRTETFSTLPHGCGRVMSREKAKEKISASDLKQKLLKKGIYLSGHSENVLREEQPEAYKSSKEVVDSMVDARLCKKAFSLRPKVVITG
jgi:tRNA-splicing ligase RtcB (3'-phosphate/5'-hydroxy nucleic acid ligase)